MNHHNLTIQELMTHGQRFDNARSGWRPPRTLSEAWRRLRRWYFEYRSIRHLESLPDHMLDDIGIDRAEITSAVRGLFEQVEPSCDPDTTSSTTVAGHRLAA
jgi:uncharacterized protein YjiS (DUF1127 family)